MEIPKSFKQQSSVKGWAVKTRSGYLLVSTVARTRKEAIQSYLGLSIMNWYWHKRKFKIKVVKVEVSEQ